MRTFMTIAAVAFVASSVLASDQPLVDRGIIYPSGPVQTGSAAPEAVTAVPVGVEVVEFGGFTTIFRQVARSYQEFIGASNFASVTEPVNITGMQVRLAMNENWRPPGYVGQSWPNAPISFTSYDVMLGAPSNQMVTDGEHLSATSVYADFISDATTVRSGPLSIAAGDYLADGAFIDGTNSWGPVMNFTTPYLLNPGEGLMFQLNHTGYGNSVAQAAFAARGPENDVTSAVVNINAGSYTATSSTDYSAPYYIQFTYAAIPEPTTLGALVAMSAVALMRRK